MCLCQVHFFHDVLQPVSARQRTVVAHHGELEVAKTNTWSLELLSPSIWISSSLFMRRLASFSLFARPPLAPTSASSSSKNIVAGELCRAISNSTLTSFSDSPRHLLTSVDAVMLKKVVLHSVATALARSVFPVPSLGKLELP